MDWKMKLSDTAEKMRASEIRELLKVTERPGIISFGGGFPDSTLFPKERIVEITKDVLLNQSDKSLQYSATEGINELRETLAKMARAEGNENISIENIVVTTSSQQGLQLTAQIFINPGDTIITEAPTYVGGIQAFSAFGANFWTVPLDNNGIRVDILKEKLKEAEEKKINIKFLYLVPNFHNPAGVTLALERRLKVIELSHHYNVPIIEDDPYGELRFTGKKIPSLLQLDKVGNVIRLRTFSKICFPSLRLGWIIADTEIIRKFTLAKQAADLCTSALTQYIAAEFIKKGYLKEYLKKVRKSYKKKMKAMLYALEKYFPEDIHWTKPQGGMFLWVKVPDFIDTTELLKEAIEEKVAYVPGSAFHPYKEDKCHFRLNFSYPTLEQIDLGIQRLGNLLRKKMANS